MVMGTLFGVITIIWPSQDREEHISMYPNMVKFQWIDYNILATHTEEEDLRDLSRGIENHTWQIARIIHDTRNHTFKIVELRTLITEENEALANA